jgi:hypothetical protein
MTVRRRVVAIASGVGLFLGVTVGGAAAIEAAHGAPSPPKACAASAQDRVTLDATLRAFRGRALTGPAAATRLAAPETRMRALLTQASDNDVVRDRLQILVDELAAARAALRTGADQQTETVARLDESLLHANRSC